MLSLCGQGPGICTLPQVSFIYTVRNLHADWYRNYGSRKRRIRESTQVGRRLYGVRISTRGISSLVPSMVSISSTSHVSFPMETTHGPHHTSQHLITSYHTLFADSFVQGRKTSPNSWSVLDSPLLRRVTASVS